MLFTKAVKNIFHSLCKNDKYVFYVLKRSVEKAITTEDDVQEWCVNIQRAIVNHFYLPIIDNEEKYQTYEDEVRVLVVSKVF